MAKEILHCELDDDDIVTTVEVNGKTYVIKDLTDKQLGWFMCCGFRGDDYKALSRENLSRKL